MSDIFTSNTTETYFALWYNHDYFLEPEVFNLLHFGILKLKPPLNSVSRRAAFSHKSLFADKAFSREAFYMHLFNIL